MANDLQPPPRMTEAEIVAVSEKHRALDVSVARLKTGDAIDAISQGLRYFEDASRNDRAAIIQANTLKNKHDLAMSEWICQRYQHLLSMAQAIVVKSFTGTHEGKATPQQGAALLMLIAGHLIKWRKFSGARADPHAREWLHQVYILTEAVRLEGAPLTVRIEDRMIEATTEALYIRALLLDRFNGGALSPRRFEILDTWLVAWIGALWLTREVADDEAAFGVDFRQKQRGFAPYVQNNGAQVFLSTRQLQRQIDRVVHTFHQGDIFPNIVATPNIKVDDQVAIIQFLEREIGLVEQCRRDALAPSQSRRKRVSLGTNSIVAVFFGFKEICNLAFATERVATLVGGGSDIGIRNAIRVMDISEGGIGLEMVDEDARLVHVHDLIAVRLEKGKPCVLGMIVRKSTLQKPSGTMIGVKVLSKTPLKLTMDRVNESNQWQACTGILIAGDAADGFGDSVVLSEEDYVANALIAATLNHRVHEFFARRVREQGIGWRMAAIDAIDRTA